MTLDLAPSRVRPSWPDLPAAVRAAVETRLGAGVSGWTSHDGGYSQGLASTLRTDAGDVFVKAVGPEHPFTADLYRLEARTARALPAGTPAPALRWVLDDDLDGVGTWVALAFDAVPGRAVATPWRDDELAAVADLARGIGEVEVPADSPLPRFADTVEWREWEDLADRRPAGLGTYDPWVADRLDPLAVLASAWPEATAGDHLVHGDLRGDNTVLVDRAAVAVDWPCAARGAAFCDAVGMLPAVQVEGGPPPEEVLRRHPLPRDVEPDAVTSYLAALTGYFLKSSLDPAPPGIPHLRAFQRAQAEVGVAWLRHRLGE
ncbi:Ser/Thr protein kinase RdoA involved in Cpx stress response, MazF antagonist [Cellulosimicrobium aquatile]|uniref:Ser/Thr protein kinase RdoA involved in Cpx stress response, MazF antagonist n=1 Tax=Cellulosimicrobium aquatile TaxID=1612203 RepID=A0A1N6W5E9_9MICO|nr:phosphotransferase [Cellulosimicrobium aquatile]NMF30012.1 aminoglycoside phosphotransferase family protein [Cellulosimicrobium aquatile]SIQ85349.1 Ser/Thr protein kinase RdoA involved in Cpx stress response, MazF antagonist [Cellulosimicrobium aquatile]